ncbi:MAG: MliC family protein [Bacteroidales bacterium]|jgi:membrane-bound inhibitor of C-type lysozyme|nr:MliC family protein [Bacteroidales bacterium]
MKRHLFAIALVTGLILSSCGENGKKERMRPAPAEISSSIDSEGNEIVDSKVTNKKGETLSMRFNNTKGTATFLIDGATIEMTTDSAASGVRYSNDHYEFTEWHGEITLKKDGKVIFKHKK